MSFFFTVLTITIIAAVFMNVLWISTVHSSLLAGTKALMAGSVRMFHFKSFGEEMWWFVFVVCPFIGFLTPVALERVPIRTKRGWLALFYLITMCIDAGMSWAHGQPWGAALDREKGVAIMAIVGFLSFEGFRFFAMLQLQVLRLCLRWKTAASRR